MKKLVFHLGNCTTCQRILKQLKLENKGFIFREIKSQRLTPAELEMMKNMAGCYQSIFTRRSLSFKKLPAKEKNSLTELKMRDMILKDYTYLKRPVIIYGQYIFCGNAPKTIAEAETIVR
jgi:arsenate reductase